MNWRPKDWENLWDKQPSDCLATPSPVWEAGADAMLEAVCEEIGKALLTDVETDKCTPSNEQLEAFLAEPDDEAASDIRATYPEMFKIIGRCILYGRNIKQAQLDKILDLFQKEAA